MDTKFSGLPAFIWSVADLLRGEFKHSQYGRIILPFTILRRLECVLPPTKDKVLAEADKCRNMNSDAAEKILLNKAGQSCFNTSPMDLNTLGDMLVKDQDVKNIKQGNTLSEDIQTYFEREILPHVPNAWIDESKRDEKDGQIGIVGYEIPFNRHFYEYVPPRPLEAIDAVVSEIMKLLNEVHS